LPFSAYFGLITVHVAQKQRVACKHPSGGMVGVRVVGVGNQYYMRACGTQERDDSPQLDGILGAQAGVGECCVPALLDPQDTRRLFRFAGPLFRCPVGRRLTARQIEDHDFVAALYQNRNGPAAFDFDVVGVDTNGEHSHGYREYTR
jgi:hypothetical protein